MMLRSLAAEPPMTLLEVPLLMMTPFPLASATVPAGSVPSRLPLSVSEPAPTVSGLPHRLIASARTVMGVNEALKQTEEKLPSRATSMSGVPANPGCVVPSIVTPSTTTIVGKSDASTIECVPEPVMLKAIVCGPAALLASVMAWRSEPTPVSAVVVTV